VIEHTRLVNISNDCADGDNKQNLLRQVPQESARERALQFAKQVPRPKPAVNKTLASQEIEHKRLEERISSASDQLVTSEEMQRQNRLRELESKHSFDKQRISNMKKSLGF
jgi:hypothetical protein